MAILTLASGAPSTIMGWRSLQRIRIFRLEDGRKSALFAALFWPLMLATAIIFGLFALPMSQGPGWVAGLGVSISLIASGILAWLVLKKTKAWLATAPSESERSHAITILSQQQSSGGTTWVRCLLAFLLVGPAIALLMTLLGLTLGFLEVLIFLLLCGLVGYSISRFRNRTESGIGTDLQNRPPDNGNPWHWMWFWIVFGILVIPFFFIIMSFLTYNFSAENSRRSDTGFGCAMGACQVMTENTLTESFLTTRWTRVLAAKPDSEDGKAALSDLCNAYYAPVHAFIRHTVRNVPPDQTRDITHEFFATLLSEPRLDSLERGRGKFRSYLLGATKHFLADHRQKAGAAKRGGGIEHDTLEKGKDVATVPTSDAIYDREWAMALVGRAIADLEYEHNASGKSVQFEYLKPWLSGNALDQPQALERFSEVFRH